MSQQRLQTVHTTTRFQPGGTAVHWWLITNGIDTSSVFAWQPIRVDAWEMTATYEAMVRLDGYPVIGKDGRFVRELTTASISFLPSVYGIPTT